MRYGASRVSFYRWDFRRASNQHLAMELFKRETKLALTHVPYKGGGPLAVDLVSGQIQVSISNILSFYPHVKAGRLTDRKSTRLNSSHG